MARIRVRAFVVGSDVEYGLEDEHVVDGIVLFKGCKRWSYRRAKTPSG